MPVIAVGMRIRRNITLLANSLPSLNHEELAKTKKPKTTAIMLESRNIDSASPLSVIPAQKKAKVQHWLILKEKYARESN